MTNYVDDWGGDLNDPSQRCKHGTFIGSWAGPDYLCHYCELGYDPEPEPPTPGCEWDDEGDCCQDARHSVDIEDAFGTARWNYCSDHMSKLFDMVTVDEYDRMWLPGAEVTKVNVGKLRMEDHHAVR